jgi:hypothetical protein
VLQTSQRETVAPGGPPTQQQQIDLINAGEMLLCRARAISRRVEERTGVAPDLGLKSGGWTSWSGLGMRQAEELLDWLAQHPDRQWQLSLGPRQKVTVRWR